MFSIKYNKTHQCAWVGMCVHTVCLWLGLKSQIQQLHKKKKKSLSLTAVTHERHLSRALKSLQQRRRQTCCTHGGAGLFFSPAGCFCRDVLYADFLPVLSAPQKRLDTHSDESALPQGSVFTDNDKGNVRGNNDLKKVWLHATFGLQCSVQTKQRKHL